MNPRLRVGLRWALGLSLLGAGVAKLMHPAEFAAELLDYRVPLTPLVWSLVAACLPWLEVILGLGLLLNFWAETVRPLVVALAGVFVLMLFQAVLRGLPLDCGCFGSWLPSWTETPPVAFARAVLVFLAGCSVLSERASSHRG
jgi:hypothetical protein